MAVLNTEGCFSSAGSLFLLWNTRPFLNFDYYGSALVWKTVSGYCDLRGCVVRKWDGDEDRMTQHKKKDTSNDVRLIATNQLDGCDWQVQILGKCCHVQKPCLTKKI